MNILPIVVDNAFMRTSWMITLSTVAMCKERNIHTIQGVAAGSGESSSSFPRASSMQFCIQDSEQ